jgi:hypothetical protein
MKNGDVHNTVGVEEENKGILTERGLQIEVKWILNTAGGSK